MHHTLAANVLIIMALSPMFSALFDRLAFQINWRLEPGSQSAVACLGVAILVSDSLSSGSQLGNLIALSSAILLGIQLSLIAQAPEREVIPALMFGYLCSVPIAALLAVRWQ